jgi:hypothetical protein
MDGANNQFIVAFNDISGLWYTSTSDSKRNSFELLQITHSTTDASGMFFRTNASLATRTKRVNMMPWPIPVREWYQLMDRGLNCRTIMPPRRHSDA